MIIKKWNICILIAVFVFVLFVLLVENRPICYVVTSSEADKIMSENDEKQSVVLFRSMISTDEIQFGVVDAEDTQKFTDMADLMGRVNPRLLNVNSNYFRLDSNAVFMTFPKKIVESTYDNERMLKIYPDELFIIVDDEGYQSELIRDASDDGIFYVKDLTIGGHIYFYLAPLLRLFAI